MGFFKITNAKNLVKSLTLNLEVPTLFSKIRPKTVGPTLCQFSKYINCLEAHSFFFHKIKIFLYQQA